MSAKAERYYQFLETTKRLDAAVGTSANVHEALGKLYAMLDTAEAIGCRLGSPEEWRECRAAVQKGLDTMEEVISGATSLFGRHLAELEGLAATQSRNAQVQAAVNVAKTRGEPS